MNKWGNKMIFSFTDAEKSIFKKRRKLKVSEWAAQNVIVPDGPYAGARYRKDVNPYLLGIMDTWGERGIEEVIVVGAPQVGKTLVLYSCLAYCVDYRPAPRMLAMPDDETMKAVVEEKLKPLFRKSRGVSKMYQGVKGRRVRFSDSTSIWISSAASPSQRASLSIQDLFLDEEALYQRYAGKGDPVTDFLERTNSYSNTRKVLRISKPVGGKECSILQALETCDEVREYNTVCPACGVAQIMEEEHFIIQGKSKDDIEITRISRESLGRYRCPHCKMEWSDAMRDRAVKAGFWQAKERVVNPRKIGFHLPGYLSQSVSLSKVVAKRLEAEKSDDAELRQAYANGILARAYDPVIHKSNEQAVLSLKDDDLAPQTVPLGAVALTCGIDMQKRGFWFMVMAWDKKLNGTIIDYGFINNFDKVYELTYQTSYRREDSDELAGIWRGLLDTGGGESDIENVTRTEEAYAFLSQYGNNVLLGAKGNSHKQINPVTWSILERMPKSKTVLTGLKLHMIDTHYFKALATARLQTNARQHFVLHNGACELLARQLCSEELVLQGKKQVWRRKRKDNHLFDCLCLNLACVHQSFTPSLVSMIGSSMFDIEPVEQRTKPAFTKTKRQTKTKRLF